MDRRQMCDGTDVRRTTLAPADHARAEGLIAKHGGMMEISRTEAGALLVAWHAGNGTTVRAEGADALSVVDAICRSVEAGDLPLT